MKRIAAFTLASVALMAGAVLVMQVLVKDGAARRAVWVAALVAVLVQTAGFAVARSLARDNVMAGWGLGVLLRFAAVFVMAFVAPSVGLPLGATLTSLVVFLFLSTLIEPLFLKQ